MMNFLSPDNRSNLRARLLLLAVVVIAFLPTWEGLAHIWSHSFGYAHGWLIALISLWLLLSDRSKLFFSKANPTAYIALLAALSAWTFARFSFTDIAEQLLLPVLIVLSAYCLYGKDGAKAVFFSAFYLIFAIPVWDVMIPFLQKATVFGVTHALSLISIPNVGKGDFISIPFGSFHVERGCSGANFVVVAIAISLLNTRLWAMPWKKSVLAISFATCLSIFANWVRVFFIVFEAWQTDMQTSLIRNHYWFGWYLFAGALIIYFLVARRLDEGKTRVSPEVIDPGVSKSDRKIQVFTTIGLLLLISVTASIRLDALNSTGSLRLISPATQTTWRGPSHTEFLWHPRFPGAFTTKLSVYHDASGHKIGFYRAVYTFEHEGSKIIGWGVSAVPAHWKVLKAAYINLNKRQLYTYSPQRVMQREIMDRQGSLWLMWSWYRLGPNTYADPMHMKLAQGLEAFSPHAARPAQRVVLVTPCFSRCSEAKTNLFDFDQTVIKNWKQ